MSLSIALPRVREMYTRKSVSMWDWKLLAMKVNNLCRQVRDLEAATPASTTTTTAASLDLTKFRFGMSYSNAIATIKAGTVYHGTGSSAIAETPKTITATAQYIYVNYAFTTRTATLEGPTTTEPVSDATNYRVWLYKFTFAGGKISDYVVGHVGNIYVPSTYA